MNKYASRKIVGTFHKTGSVLWRSICLRAQAEDIFQLWDLHMGEPTPKAEVIFSFQPLIVSETLSDYFADVRDDDRWLISVRDPRDVVVSCAYYHSRTEEKWCNVPNPTFGGLSYQEKILSYSSIQDRFLFEMDYVGGLIVSRMIEMKNRLENSNAKFVKLEQLSHDVNLALFRDCYSHLGFDPGRISDLLAISTEASLFSKPRPIKEGGHARSTSVAQFRSEFDEKTYAKFIERFGDAASRLGYPEDGIELPSLEPLEGRRDREGNFWPSRISRRDANDAIAREVEKTKKEAEEKIEKLTGERDAALEKTDAALQRIEELIKERDSALKEVRASMRDPIPHAIKAYKMKISRRREKKSS